MHVEKGLVYNSDKVIHFDLLKADDKEFREHLKTVLKIGTKLYPFVQSQQAEKVKYEVMSSTANFDNKRFFSDMTLNMYEVYKAYPEITCDMNLKEILNFYFKDCQPLNNKFYREHLSGCSEILKVSSLTPEEVEDATVFYMMTLSEYQEFVATGILKRRRRSTDS